MWESDEVRRRASDVYELYDSLSHTSPPVMLQIMLCVMEENLIYHFLHIIDNNDINVLITGKIH
jgi:hypothetical protein